MPTTRRRKIPVTADERQIMLWWWTIYGGNVNKTARKVSEITGIPRHRKVVHEVAKKFNFATLSHVVRQKVHEQFNNDNTPGTNRIRSMLMDLIEIDENIVIQIKNYLIGGQGRTTFTNTAEMIAALKYITADLQNLTGKKNLKDTPFEDIVSDQKPDIEISVMQLLEELDEKEKAEVMEVLVDGQTSRILDFKR